MKRVLYYVADKPIRPGSLLDQFVNGDDAFRNSRFKLIPSIVEGYWMVKRAVGTKACILGKAITCNYLRKDNFLEVIQSTVFSFFLEILGCSELTSH